MESNERAIGSCKELRCTMTSLELKRLRERSLFSGRDLRRNSKRSRKENVMISIVRGRSWKCWDVGLF
ncbi:hypothetical protein ACFX1Q_040839 [Malus domestica]